MSWITKKIVFPRPHAIPEFTAPEFEDEEPERILPPGTGAAGFVVVIGPNWTCRYVRSVDGELQPPKTAAFHFIRDSLQNRDVFQAFQRRVVWAETVEEWLARVIERNRAVGVIPDGAVVRVVDVDQLPPDQALKKKKDREQWRWTGNRVEPVQAGG
jgi:hypothetical protein